MIASDRQHGLGVDGGESTAVLSARGVGWSYGSRRVLSDVSVAVSAGEIVAVAGPNGAGKTTLLAILAGVLRGDDGEVTCVGRPGWAPQGGGVYRRLTVVENLRLFARLEGVESEDRAVARMLDQAGLSERADDLVGTLSGGNRQRVNVAIGLIADPAVLLLDEPTAALDPVQRERFWRFLTTLTATGVSVVFSTHIIDEADRFADRLIVLDEGRDVFAGTPDELRERMADAAGVAGDPTPITPRRDLTAAFCALLAPPDTARGEVAEAAGSVNGSDD